MKVGVISLLIDTVTLACCSQTGANEISSNAKSFPSRFKFKFVIQILAVVAVPEFQVLKNSSQMHVFADALKFRPIGIPLMVNCNSAGFIEKTLASQAENK